MSRKRSRSGLLSRIAAPIAEAARRMARRRAAEAEALEEAERQVDLARQLGGSPFFAPLAPEDFRMAMEQMLGQDQGRYGTKLHVISLVEFHEAVGERWHRVSDKVMLIAEGVITKYLGSGNLFARQGTDFFTLLFRTGSPADATARAQAIAQELGTRLMGDQFQGAERPLALATEMDLGAAFGPDGTMDFAAIHHAVGEKRLLIAGMAGDNGSPGWIPPLSHPAAAAAAFHPRRGSPATESQMVEDDGHLPQSVTTNRERRVALKDPSWVAMEAPRRERAEPAWISLKTGTAAAPPPSGVADKADRLAEGTQLALSWLPTWVAADEAICAYLARVQRMDGPGGAPRDGALAYSDQDERSIIALDRYCIAGAMRDFRISEQAGNGSAVVVPIHWRTLTAENRMDLLAPFADVTRQVRESRVIIDLFGLPAQVGAAQLAQVVGFARTLCREVLVRGRLTQPDVRLVADSGASVIGIDLSHLTPAERGDDATLLLSLRRFLDQAHACGLGGYVWGARRRAVVVGAVQGGFSLVNGPALMKDIVKPARVLPAPKSRFSTLPS